jgi:hypothetical protein
MLGTMLVLLAGAGCERRDDPGQDAPAAVEAPGWSPEAQMRATLSDLVHAQQRYYQEHDRFSTDPGLLVEEYEFRPVGEATVTISFVAADEEAERGYLAVALHPLSDQQCEVQHTLSPVAARETVGEIVCTAP